MVAEHLQTPAGGRGQAVPDTGLTLEGGEERPKDVAANTGLILLLHTNYELRYKHRAKYAPNVAIYDAKTQG